MNDAANPQEDLREKPGMSKEESFFGVTHPVQRPSLQAEKDRPKVTVDPEDAEDEPVIETVAKQSEKSDKIDDEDLSEYSERVQKRIKRLTWEAKEAARQRDAVRAERDEALKVTQSLYGQNQQMHQIITTGEAQLVDRIKSSAEKAVEAAKAKFKEVYESGETDQIIAAQEGLIAAQAEAQQAALYVQDYEQRRQFAQRRPQFQQVPMMQPHPAQQQQRPDPEASDWAKKNPWFGTGPEARRDMTAVAFAKHETLVTDDGVTVNSPEYYEEIDKEMRLRFPEYFEKGKGGTATSTSRNTASSVVAPAGRSNAAEPRKVRLNASQKSIAKRLGLTYEQYATQLLKDRGMI